MKKLGLLMAVVLLGGCNEIEGTLDAFTDFSLKTKKSEVLITEGSHEATLKFKSKKKIQLKMKVNGKKKTIPFNLKDEYDFPKRNGSFEIAAEDNSQGLDIAGDVKTEVEIGRRQFDRESCERTEYRRECKYDGHGRRLCRDVPYRRRGWKDIEFHYEIEEREVNFSISNSDEELGNFYSQGRYRRKVVDYEGYCRY